MKTIPLTRDKVALVSDLDFVWLTRYEWRAIRSASGIWYAQTGPRSRVVWMHRLIKGKPNYLVDHKNRDGLDNRRRNLRTATRSQNGANRKINSNNKSGFKGVWWDAQRGLWRASIRLHGKAINLGWYRDPAAGGRAYKKAATKLFGEFARTL